MSKNIKVNNVTYNAVSSISVPLAAGGGNATFPDTSDANAGAGDIASGKTAYVNGSKITGTATGGGGTPTPISKKDVNFYDYDRTLVASYTLAEAQNLTALPAQPDHSGDDVQLTGQGWNYTLAQVNALTRSCDIGALYATTDGKTHFFYTITAVTGYSPKLTINNTGGGTLTVNWGNGSADQTASGTGIKTFTPASLISIGSYDLRISSTANYAMPTMTSSTYIFGSNVYNKCITKGYLSSQVTSIGGYTFFKCYSLTSITIPQSVTSIGNYALSTCPSLTSITIPQSITSIGTYAFYTCYSLTSITIPQGVTSIGDYAFYNCYSCILYDLSRVTSVPTLSNTNAFTNINSITKILVPSALLSSFQTATNWVTYANYMVGV